MTERRGFGGEERGKNEVLREVDRNAAKSGKNYICNGGHKVGETEERRFGGKSLVKSFGKKCVLTGATFSLPLSGIVGIFGLNGSGKTTLLKILAGLDRDFSGELLKTDFEDVAYMSTEGGFPFGMSARDAVNFYDSFTPRLERDKILEETEKAGIRLKSPLFSLSSGLKQYFKFLLTAYSGARVCLFDEPLSNLDVNMRAKIAEMMIMKCGEGRLFIVTTHEIKEMETLIDGFLILKNGILSDYFQSEEVRERTGKSVSEFYKERVNG